MKIVCQPDAVVARACARCFLLLLLTVVMLPGCDAASPRSDDPAGASAVRSPMRAVSVLVPVGDSNVSGTLHFSEQDGVVQIQGKITGLSPGKHGFHVHQYGDLTDQQTGKSAGGHFNPTDKPHGRPGEEERHVGDLGNIQADENGTAEIQIEDNVIQLHGARSIIGRALVVHAEEDKFTQPSGDAGDRVAFGVIGIGQPEP